MPKKKNNTSMTPAQRKKVTRVAALDSYQIGKKPKPVGGHPTSRKRTAGGGHPTSRKRSSGTGSSGPSRPSSRTRRSGPASKSNEAAYKRFMAMTPAQRKYVISMSRPPTSNKVRRKSGGAR